MKNCRETLRGTPGPRRIVCSPGVAARAAARPKARTSMRLLEVSQMDNDKISTWAGFVGGGVFTILNVATNGNVPGGFKGGVVGFLLGYALAWLVLAFVRSGPSMTSQSVKEHANKCQRVVVRCEICGKEVSDGGLSKRVGGIFHSCLCMDCYANRPEKCGEEYPGVHDRPRNQRRSSDFGETPDQLTR